MSLEFHEGLSGGEGNCLTALRAKDMLMLETLLGRSPMLSIKTTGNPAG